MRLRECEQLVMERTTTRSAASRDKRQTSELLVARKRARVSSLEPEASLGMENANGSAASHKLGPKAWVDRREFVRLLQQGLHSLGYSDVATRLQQVSHSPLRIYEDQCSPNESPHGL